jgi:hypothetical protein
MQIGEVMDTTQDKESLQYRIPAFGSHVCIVLFNPDRWDGELVPLGNGIPPESVQENYKVRGLRLVGTFGFLNGKFCSAWESPVPEDNAIDYLARCYTEWLYATLVTCAPSQAVADNNVAWLKQLYSLPDTREN